jgi:predicted ATP-grasp superfamily ATP-dependent carboligase
MKKSVLIAGFATRHVACSAWKAGYDVYSVDHFCDRDLFWYTRDAVKFEELVDLPSACAGMIGRHQIDMAVFTSGAEAMHLTVPVKGTPPDRIERFLDKQKTQEFFEELGIPAPRIAGDGQYPAMIKPRTGSGGWRNRIIGNDSEKMNWEIEFENPPYIMQEVAGGIPASVCCLANGETAVAVSTNEQILRGENAAPYGFSGSVTPFVSAGSDRLVSYAEKIAAASGCEGCIGIDFIEGDGVWAIEVNPRFQATLDTVEMATGINLFEAHIRACDGTLPGSRPAPGQYAVRTILFAERDLTVTGDMSRLAPAVADIPWPGTEFEEGHAVVSVYGQGKDRDEALSMLDKHIVTVRQYMK